MVLIGKVVGTRVDYNRDDEDKSVLLDVEFSDSDDVQTVQWVDVSGESSRPIPNDYVITIPIGPGYKIAIAVLDEIEPEESEGEKELFSRDSSGKLARLKLDENGKVLMNAGGRNVARKNDEIKVTAITDKKMIVWITKVTTFINGLASGTILPNEIPSDITGSITQGSASVEVPND